VTQSREGAGGPLWAELCVRGVPGHPVGFQKSACAA
jgi:hypothetical protein